MSIERTRFWLVSIASLLAVSLFAGDAFASSFSIIYTFQGGSDGAYPQPPLLDIGGTLYGATQAGGGSGGTNCNSFGCGTVFSITPTGAEKIIYSFQDGSDGKYPGSLFKADNSIVGDSQNDNEVTTTLFSLTTKGKFNVLAQNAGLMQAGSAMTKVSKTYYGVVGGDHQFTNCENAACGYVYAYTP